ncbi:MAG TPA: PaaI family thioesterase [Dehalococcoidia bacterium]
MNGISGEPGRDLLAQEREFARRSPYYGHLGLEVAALGDGTSTVVLHVSEALLQRHGHVHGGAIASLADAAASAALRSVVGLDTRIATVELSLSYLEIVERGDVFGYGRVLRCGRTIAVANVEIRDPAERLLAVGRATFAILGGRNGG